jgi:hypothetical protein
VYILCPKGRLYPVRTRGLETTLLGGASDMSEIHMALIFVGILLLVVVILVVWAGMVCGLPCVGVGDVG